MAIPELSGNIVCRCNNIEPAHTRSFGTTRKTKEVIHASRFDEGEVGPKTMVLLTYINFLLDSRQ